MRLGDAELQLVSDGTFRMDGGSIFGVVPKTVWRQWVSADRQNRVELGLNCLLVKSNGKNILIDTGLGSKHGPRRRSLFAMRAGNLPANLARAGLQPHDIDLVALTHLHFDHAGGCTRYNNQGSLEPVFPRATYLVQRLDWEEATKTNERTRAAYLPEDFIPLSDARQLELLDGDTELLPGLWVRHTGGHTAGHQMAFIESNGEKAACFGDLVPQPHHLPAHYMTAYDLFPLDTLHAKRHWLAKAADENWLVFFGHGTAQKAGRITSLDGRFTLRPCAPDPSIQSTTERN